MATLVAPLQEIWGGGQAFAVKNANGHVITWGDKGSQSISGSNCFPLLLDLAGQSQSKKSSDSRQTVHIYICEISIIKKLICASGCQFLCFSFLNGRVA